jgi:hypothetical protein
MLLNTTFVVNDRNSPPKSAVLNDKEMATAKYFSYFLLINRLNTFEHPCYKTEHIT